MQRTSFEKSLAFLAPSLTVEKKKKVVSPVRVPEHNEEDLLDIESLLKGDSPTSVSSEKRSVDEEEDDRSVEEEDDRSVEEEDDRSVEEEERESEEEDDRSVEEEDDDRSVE